MRPSRRERRDRRAKQPKEEERPVSGWVRPPDSTDKERQIAAQKKLNMGFDCRAGYGRRRVGVVLVEAGGLILLFGPVARSVDGRRCGASFDDCEGSNPSIFMATRELETAKDPTEKAESAVTSHLKIVRNRVAIATSNPATCSASHLWPPQATAKLCALKSAADAQFGAQNHCRPNWLDAAVFRALPFWL